MSFNLAYKTKGFENYKKQAEQLKNNKVNLLNSLESALNSMQRSIEQNRAILDNDATIQSLREKIEKLEKEMPGLQSKAKAGQEAVVLADEENSKLIDKLEELHKLTGAQSNELSSCVAQANTIKDSIETRKKEVVSQLEVITQLKTKSSQLEQQKVGYDEKISQADQAKAACNDDKEKIEQAIHYENSTLNEYREKSIECQKLLSESKGLNISNDATSQNSVSNNSPQSLINLPIPIVSTDDLNKIISSLFYSQKHKSLKSDAENLKPIIVNLKTNNGKITNELNDFYAKIESTSMLNGDKGETCNTLKNPTSISYCKKPVSAFLDKPDKVEIFLNKFTEEQISKNTNEKFFNTLKHAKVEYCDALNMFTANGTNGAVANQMQQVVDSFCKDPSNSDFANKAGNDLCKLAASTDSSFGTHFDYIC